MPLVVLVAPDSFKGTLGAPEVAEAISDGWRAVRPDDELVIRPQADGGEGTLAAVERSVASSVRRSAGLVTGPDGKPTPGEWLELPGGVAVVELAQSCGLPLMRRPDPLRATTRGLGEVIRAALESGATSLVIGLGGSASSDGGAGALQALGLSLLDEQDELISDGGASLIDIVAIERDYLVPAPAGGVILLTDVTAPLLGPSGAAAVFGPQKGATPAQVERLEQTLTHFAHLLGCQPGETGAPGTGAAGGTAFGFAAVWGASIRSGAEYIAELSGLPEALSRADIVLTGEGRFDSQSFNGKVVGHQLSLAGGSGVVAGVIAGQVEGDLPSDVWTACLADLAGSEDAAMAEPAEWLRLAGSRAAAELAPAGATPG
jgi:glycerate kinase